MNIFQKFLEIEEENNKDQVNGDDYNIISYIISQLDPILNDSEILEAINADINKKYNIDSLAQLIEVQLALTINEKSIINISFY